MSDSETENLPLETEEAAANVVSSLLPDKSQAKYEKFYKRFTDWCTSKKVKNEANEKVILAFFENLSKKYKCSSLWAFYSMLRATITMKQNVDISKFNHLVAFLKKQSVGHRPKKSRVLTKEDIAKFLKEAGDKEFLLIKVALIIGLGGACRADELTNLQLENVKKEERLFHIFIPNTKTKVSREFFITVGGIEGVNVVEVIQKYLALRPNHAVLGRFFVEYRGGNCIKLPVGINTFSAMPKKIASFLNLPQAQEYTGHCFRRSSTSLLANTGADLLAIKRHGGWRSNALCEGYIDTSVENKKKTASKILGGEITDNEAGTSASNTSYQNFSLLGRELAIPQVAISQQNLNVISKNSDQMTSSPINFTDCKNCVINIYQK